MSEQVLLERLHYLKLAKAYEREAYLEDQLRQTQEDLDGLRETLRVQYGNLFARNGEAGTTYRFIPARNEDHARHRQTKLGLLAVYRYQSQPVPVDPLVRIR